MAPYSFIHFLTFSCSITSLLKIVLQIKLGRISSNFGFSNFQSWIRKSYVIEFELFGVDKFSQIKSKTLFGTFKFEIDQQIWILTMNSTSISNSTYCVEFCTWTNLFRNKFVRAYCNHNAPPNSYQMILSNWTWFLKIVVDEQVRDKEGFVQLKMFQIFWWSECVRF